MITDPVCFTPPTELTDRISSVALSPTAVVHTHLERIDEPTDRTNAYVTVLHDRASERARDAERAIANGEHWGPLHGVPLAIRSCPPDDGTDYIGAVERSIDNLSVAYSPGLCVFPIQVGVQDVLDDPVEALSAAGADVTAVDPPFDRLLEKLFEVWKTTWEACTPV